MNDFPRQDRPPTIIPFFAFRIMVGCGVVLLLLAWVGSYFSVKGIIERTLLLLGDISELSTTSRRGPDLDRRLRPCRAAVVIACAPDFVNNPSLSSAFQTLHGMNLTLYDASIRLLHCMYG